MVAVVKEKFKYDDALDAFGVHGIGGILGSILTGVFATDLSISTSMVRVHTATDITLHKKRVCQNSLILKKSQSPDFHKPGLCYV